MKKSISLLLLLLVFITSYSQIVRPAKTTKTYLSETVVDKENGIMMYEGLNPLFGGDSIRNTPKGYACQGWVEDIYQSGAVLHKGFYVDGQLSVYRNFYENGKVERVFGKDDVGKAKLQSFYNNGNLKSEIDYVNGRIQHIQRFYENGVTQYVEEYDKTLTYLIEKSSYFKNGDPESTIELTDPKILLYHQIDYAKNGNLKLEGNLKFNNGIARFTKEQYIKDGFWKIYNDNGDLAEEMFFMNGQLSDPTKVNIANNGSRKGKKS